MTKNLQGYVDLHLHSTHSDGLHPPDDLVRMAAELGLRTIAIADHDAVEGIDSAIEEGERLGVEVIPAVELTVSHLGLRDLHLLGYLIDHHDPQFVSRLEGFRKSRDERAKAIIERINSKLSEEKRGNISYVDVLTHAGGAVGRPHIAMALIENGYCKGIEEAFERYLIPCNVPKFKFHIADAIAEIKRIGGVSVLAHPPSIQRDMETVKTIIRDLSRMGLDGLELYSNMCYKEDINFFNNIARQLDLLVTGGSDFHGFQDDRGMGRASGGMKIPYLLVEKLKKRKNDKVNKPAHM